MASQIISGVRNTLTQLTVATAAALTADDAWHKLTGSDGKVCGLEPDTQTISFVTLATADSSYAGVRAGSVMVGQHFLAYIQTGTSLWYKVAAGGTPTGTIYA